ncbi:MAG: hypothetical protein LUC98_07860 [Lachnospiraceae bacterium]|nr:hypothetical protein [Lachnospiraceae bacterium]
MSAYFEEDIASEIIVPIADLDFTDAEMQQLEENILSSGISESGVQNYNFSFMLTLEGESYAQSSHFLIYGFDAQSGSWDEYACFKIYE